MKSLAVKYRPKRWEDVVEQSTVRTILEQQLADNDIKHCYLFCGSAGTGKTTCARIFANEINKGEGNPIEMDAASNNGVDDMRGLIEQAVSKPLAGSYKVFIIDECHMITVAGWNAILKLLEEPPESAVFIFCTTDPQKIPATIISRVQRYKFQRISFGGIVKRLEYICNKEAIDMVGSVHREALDYIAKVADGGMRDAIMLLDKCLSYSSELILANVVQALGQTDYMTALNLIEGVLFNDAKKCIQVIEEIYNAGKDLKAFATFCLNINLDVCKYSIFRDFKYLNYLPELPDVKKWLDDMGSNLYDTSFASLGVFRNIASNIKYIESPKYFFESAVLEGIA